MDEPTASLDPIATAVIEELMSSLCNEFTIVAVTHNMQQAARASRASPRSCSPTKRALGD